MKKKELEEIENLKSQLGRYQAIIDIEAEVVKQKNELEQLISAKSTEIISVQENLNALNSDYKSALGTYAKLRKEVSLRKRSNEGHSGGTA